jgi:hypothetical protein
MVLDFQGAQFRMMQMFQTGNMHVDMLVWSVSLVFQLRGHAGSYMHVFCFAVRLAAAAFAAAAAASGLCGCPSSLCLCLCEGVTCDLPPSCSARRWRSERRKKKRTPTDC